MKELFVNNNESKEDTEEVLNKISDLTLDKKSLNEEEINNILKIVNKLKYDRLKSVIQK